MVGIECKHPVASLLQACREKGLLVLQAGPNVIRMLPPLNITEEELSAAVAIMEDAFAEVFAVS